jgi:hypothetical protein
MPSIHTALRTFLFDWRPAALALIAVLLATLMAQAPAEYRFRVGIERGPQSDAPFLQGFYKPEGIWPSGMYRWSRTEFASLTLPAIGRRPVSLQFTVISHRAQHDPTQNATTLTLEHGATRPAPQFALRREAAHYHVLLPAEALPDGALRLSFATPTWQNQGDSRDELGAAFAQSMVIRSLAGQLPVLPDRSLLVGLAFGIYCCWSTLRLIGFDRRNAWWLVFPLAFCFPLLPLIDLGRAGFLGPWFMPVGLLLLAAAAVASVVLPPLLRALSCLPPTHIMRWLVLLVALVFALKYGGRFYPDAMPGDWQLHINRFNFTVMGDLSVRAQHRGLPFPFPQGYYLDIAPLIVTGIPVRPWLPLLAAIFEAASLPVIYAILARPTSSPQRGLLAAVMYAITAHGVMNTWFSFHTQVSTQFFTALLMLLLSMHWPRYSDPHIWWPITMVLLQQFLGHIGTFINAGLLGTLTLLVLWRRANASQQHGLRALALAGIAAFSFAMLGYYSLFTGLIIEQINGVANRGLLEVTGKKAIPALVHLNDLWEHGLITHYGFFPVLLAIPGCLWLHSRLRTGILPVLLWGTLAVSAVQGLLPFFTQSAIMTRWLTFAAWAIAIGAGAGLLLWWQRGRAARIAGMAMLGYAAWITLVIFAEAMTQRLPPIEPF